MAKKRKDRNGENWPILLLLLLLLVFIVGYWWNEWQKKTQGAPSILAPEVTPVPMMLSGGGGGGGGTPTPTVTPDFDANDFNSADFDTGLITS